MAVQLVAVLVVVELWYKLDCNIHVLLHLARGYIHLCEFLVSSLPKLLRAIALHWMDLQSFTVMLLTLPQKTVDPPKSHGFYFFAIFSLGIKKKLVTKIVTEYKSSRIVPMMVFS
jgi:hypothetical protein